MTMAATTNTNNKDSHRQQQSQPLLTPTSTALSLSPPRIPPHGSILRSLYTHPVATWRNLLHPRKRQGFGPVHRHTKSIFLDDSNGRTTNTNSIIIQANHHPNDIVSSRMLHLILSKKSISSYPIPNHSTSPPFLHHHPHLPTSLSLPDQMTRWLGAILPLHVQHAFRDNGYFRLVADSLVTATCPLMGLGHWKEVRDFVELSHDVAKDEEEDEAKEMILAATATGDDCNKEATNDNSRNDGEDGLAKDTKQARREDATPTKRRRRSRRKWTRRRIPYGQHSSIQYIDLYLPSPPLGKESESKEDSDQSSSTDTIPKIPIRGTIFFVHGGAWGSGKPWMYRLISPTFLKLNFAVVIVGYRVYPNATTIDDQVGDVLLAWEKAGDVIRKSVVRMSSVSCKTRSDATSAGAKDNAHDEWIGNVIMGHSSGAHVAMLMLAQWIQTKLHQQRNSQSTNLSEKDIGINYPWKPNYFIGLSGPYDINDHFDYEANRGVEQISPMKPICGHSRENFHAAGPVRRFLALFREQSEDDSMHRRTETISIQQLTPPILLVHGIEDATVPFTSTADAGRILRSCGLQRCDEIYLDETGHQDVVVHFMFGGPTKDLTLDWLFHCCRDMRNRSSSNIQSRL